MTYPYNPNATAVGQTSNYAIPIPGQYSRDNLAGVGITEKYTVATGANNVSSGFFVGRQLNSNATYTVVNSLDNITSPTIANILGVIAINNWATLPTGMPRIGGTYEQWATLATYGAGEVPNIANNIPGYIWVWSGATITPGDDLYVYAGPYIPEDDDGNAIYTGTLVPLSWVTANTATATSIDVSSNVKLNPQFNILTTYGDYGTLVQVAINFNNR